MAALLTACGDEEKIYHVTGGMGGDGAGGSSGGRAGSSGAAGERDDAPPPDCVGEIHEAHELPVAMYIMLDRSGSMEAPTGAGPSKWNATVEALTNFVQSEGSSGMWVGLQYFPLGADGVADSCQSDLDCGAAGPCLNKACLPPAVGQSFFIPCLDDFDCPLDSPGCAAFGQCELDATLACFTPGSPQGCGTAGSCDFFVAECLSFGSCDVADYATPAVEIGTLPDNAQALVDSLASEGPLGLTPTSVALQGALDQAADFAASHPDHAVIVVLATDGEPTECEPTEIGSVAAIARAGANGEPSLRTHVIGVFAPEEVSALGNLQLLASAGGSENALIVDPSEDVSVQLLEALDKIRSGAVGCELQLPPAPEEVTLDFNRVNVEFTDGDRVRQLTFVDEVKFCRDVELGWYYDRPLKQGSTPPGRIVMCPLTCEAIQDADDAKVDIRLGCLTRTPD
jgi:hypothetical protein